VNYKREILRHDDNNIKYIVFNVPIRKNENLAELNDRRNAILQAEKLLKENG
jgi:hypothetical protein